jgi:hypothetical protein
MNGRIFGERHSRQALQRRKRAAVGFQDFGTASMDGR